MTENALFRNAGADIGTDVRTFLIADVRGYTSFTLEHGDAAAARLLTTFTALTRDAVGAHGGKVIELRGDEALAVFSSTRQALWAAVEMQARFTQEFVADCAAPLKAGIGIDAGEAIPMEGGFRGAALNLAARLCSLAGPGEILITDAIAHLARKVDGLEYLKRGAVELKGFAEPVMVMEVRVEREPSQAAVSTPSLEEERARLLGGVKVDTLTLQPLPIGGFLGALPAGLLVARDAELKRALGSIHSVESGVGCLLLLTGEPGVGKTRLAQEITLAARNRGFLIAAGSCYEARMSSAYYPWVDVLSTLYRLASPQLRSRLTHRFPHLAKLLPNESLSAAITSDGQEEQDRLFWSVSGFVQALAEEQPLTLLLDDLHWADGSSLDLLQHLSRHTRGDRVLIVATHRDVEVGRQHPLEATLRELAREDLAERIAMGRLDKKGTAQLLVSTLGHEDASEEVATLLHERTEGNPFFLQQVLRVLVERGDVFQHDGDWTRRKVAEIEVPESIRSVIGQRLSRLSEEPHTILHEASVLGQTFLFNDLSAMAGRKEQEIESALDAAVAAGLVRETTGDRYNFDHALTQQSLYSELTSRRRRRLHLAAGDAIETLPERHREKRVDELAWHFLQADQRTRALPYILEAGEIARAVHANHDAERQFRTAAELAQELDDKPREAQALEKLAEILYMSSRYAEQIEIADRAVQLYAGLGDLEGEGRVVARRGWGYYMGGTISEHLPYVRALLARFDGREPTPGLFALQESLATLFANNSQYAAQALIECDRALDLAHVLDEDQFVARAQGRRGLAMSTLNRDNEALAAFEVAIPLAERVGDLDTLQRALHNASFIYLQRGDGDRYEEFQRRSLESARRAGNPHGTISSLFNLHTHLFERGEWTEAWALIAEALRLLRQTPVGAWSGIPVLQGYRMFLEGDGESAYASWAECMTEAERSGATNLRSFAIWHQAEADWLTGRPMVGIGRLEREVERPEVDHGTTFLLQLLLGRLWLETETAEGSNQARALVCSMIEDGNQPSDGTFDLDIRPLQAWLAGEHGDRIEASRLMEETTAPVRRLGYVWSEAQALHVRARMEAQLGDAEVAHRHFVGALAIYRQLGAVPFIKEAERQLVRLG